MMMCALVCIEGVRIFISWTYGTNMNNIAFKCFQKHFLCQHLRQSYAIVPGVLPVQDLNKFTIFLNK